jgi:hypothetical protein
MALTFAGVQQNRLQAQAALRQVSSSHSGGLGALREAFSIDTVFDKYSKMKGVTMLNLAKDVLEKDTHVDRYKCLIINGDNVNLNFSDITGEIELAIKKDFHRRNDLGNQSVIRESITNGQLQTVYYMLAREPFAPFEYILYSKKNRKITLIYLKGNFGEGMLDYELKQLKNLFIKIKINN